MLHSAHYTKVCNCIAYHELSKDVYIVSQKCIFGDHEKNTCGVHEVLTRIKSLSGIFVAVTYLKSNIDSCLDVVKRRLQSHQNCFYNQEFTRFDLQRLRKKGQFCSILGLTDSNCLCWPFSLAFKGQRIVFGVCTC